MIRKSPGYIKLMAHSKNGADIPRARDIRTVSSLFMTGEERESLSSAMDFRALGREVRRERDKFTRQDLVLEKFQKTYLKARDKLAATINKNQALMELRYELQARRRKGEVPGGQAPSSEEVKLPPTSRGEKSFNHVEMGY